MSAALHESQHGMVALTGRCESPREREREREDVGFAVREATNPKPYRPFTHWGEGCALVVSCELFAHPTDL